MPGLGPSPEPPPITRVTAAVLLAVAVALFHGPSVRSGFVYDDRWTIVENPVVRTPSAAFKLLAPELARAGVPDAGRPVMLVTVMLDRALWGARPAGYHLQSLFWHWGVAFLLFLWARRALMSGTALAAALVFAVHPLHVEAVAAINYREDLLAAFFVLLSMILLRAGQGGRRTAAFFALATGALAKENAYLAVALLALVDQVTPDARPPLRARVLDYLTLGGAALVVFVWRWWVFAAPGVVSVTAEVGESNRQLSWAIPQGAAAFWRGLAHLIFPVGLSPEYSHAPTWLGVLATGGLAALVAAALLARRMAPAPALGTLAGVLAYVPHFGLFPLSNVAADRYFYLPAIFLTFAVTAGLGRVVRRPALRQLGVGVAVLTLGLLTLRQGRVWRSDLSVWTTATAAAPESPRAFMGLAEARLRRGDRLAALAAVDRAAALAPGDADILELRGLVLLEQGATGEARKSFEEALGNARTARGRAQLLNNLGVLELRAGSPGAALVHLQEALRLNPGAEGPALNAARAYQLTSDLGAAERVLRALLSVTPGSIEGWKQLGLLLEKQRRRAEALAALHRARALAGADDRELSEALGRLNEAVRP